LEFSRISRHYAVILERLTTKAEADDPNDTFLISIEGKADYLITGDHRAGLLKKGKIESTRILTPAVFCAEVI
jgi:predicted nucleic acid-binding protein